MNRCASHGSRSEGTLWMQSLVIFDARFPSFSVVRFQPDMAARASTRRSAKLATQEVPPWASKSSEDELFGTQPGRGFYIDFVIYNYN